MEPLFRLVLMRPAIAQDPGNPSIDLAQDSPFQQGLADAAAAENAREALLRHARAFVAEPDFVGDPDTTPLAAQLAAFSFIVDELQSGQSVSNTRVVNAVEEAFGT